MARVWEPREEECKNCSPQGAGVDVLNVSSRGKGHVLSRLKSKKEEE